MFNRKRATAREGRYLLLLGADLTSSASAPSAILRERAVIGAIRAYSGMVVGMGPNPISAPNRLLDHMLSGNMFDPPGALEAVKEFERSEGLRPEAVVPVIEMTVPVAVEIAEHYGLPAISRQCLRFARDKHAMKEAFERAGLPTARHVAYSTLAELQQAARSLRFPLVLKPRDFAGSVGTIKVDGPAGLEAAHQHCRSSLLGSSPAYGLADGRFQAEEFVESTHEVSIEVLNYGDRRMVMSVTDKLVTKLPYFAEIGHTLPSRDNDNQPLRTLAMNACAALQIDRGIAHVEVLLNAGTGAMSLVEVGARPGGDGLMDMIDRVYGFNPYEYHVAAYLGTLTEFPDTNERAGTAGVALLKASGGRITGVSLPKDFAPQQIGLYVTARPGDQSQRDITSNMAREGAAEFFWPKAPQARTGQMLEAAQLLSQTIFSVEP